MATLNSFDNLANFLQKKQRIIEKETYDTARDIAQAIERWVKELHWKQLDWYPEQTSKSPLLKTHKLKNSVVSSSRQNLFEVTTNDQFIGKIQEYGKLIKMTAKQRRFLFAVLFKDSAKKVASKGMKGYIRIPPRPLWRYAKENKLREWIAPYLQQFKINIFK